MDFIVTIPWVVYPLAILIILAILSVRIVSQGYNYTVEHFGRYSRTLEPGIHFLIPLVDRVGARVNMMENYLDIERQDIITKDNAAASVDGVVFFRVIDARMATYHVTNLKGSVQYLALTNIRTVMGSMDLDELLSNREAINAQLLRVIDEATNPWGICVTRIEIKDIKPPEDLVVSMARQMKAEREKRARILEAEGMKEAEITKSEGIKRSRILEAEAQKAELVLHAEGRLESAQKDAEARERLASAEALATKVVSEALAEGKQEALHYFIAQKYIEAFNNMGQSGNQKVIFMPIETSSLIGSLGGIAELMKETKSA